MCGFLIDKITKFAIYKSNTPENTLQVLHSTAEI